MDDNEQCHGVGDLAGALMKDPGGWTDMLLHLIAKADEMNRTRLAYGFPDEVALYETWVGMIPAPTAAEVRRAWSNILGVA